MKKILLFIVIGVFTYSVFGQINDISTTVGVPNVTLTPGTYKSLSASGVELVNNGPLVNSIGTGSGGANESVLQGISLGMNTLGSGFQTSFSNSIADDFTFASTSDISQIKVFAYQTGSTTASTITAVYLRIYDGQPGAGGNIIWGDLTTNRMSSSTWSGIYRVSETTSGSTNRPIMECICDVNTRLTANTYWLEVQVNGSLASGPWCPPITINGNNTTGNAVQYTGAWNPLLDSGTSTPQGIPFVISGSPAVPLHPGYIIGLFGLLAVVVVLKRRFF